MSALPPKADIGEGIAECPLMTQSGHSPTDPEARLRHPNRYEGAAMNHFQSGDNKLTDTKTLQRSRSHTSRFLLLFRGILLRLDVLTNSAQVYCHDFVQVLVPSAYP